MIYLVSFLEDVPGKNSLQQNMLPFCSIFYT